MKPNTAAVLAVVFSSISVGLVAYKNLTKDVHNCASIKTDTALMNMCIAAAPGCTITYKELQGLVRRVQMCAYEEPKK